MNIVLRNFCSSPSFSSSTVSKKEAEDFLLNQSNLNFCRGRMFELFFEPLTENVLSVKRRWV